jgi:hypothetical protein
LFNRRSEEPPPPVPVPLTARIALLVCGVPLVAEFVGPMVKK